MWFGFSIVTTNLVLCVLFVCILNYQEKEEAKNFKRDDVIVKLPKFIMILMLVSSVFFVIIGYLTVRNPEGGYIDLVTIFFGIFYLIFAIGSFIMALGVLLWKIEVFGKEDYFIYHTWFGRTYTIKYSECLEYIEKKAHEGMIIRTEKKRFYIHALAANSGRFMHRIRCSKAKKVKKFTK